jgi:hypothetical protein
MQAVTADQRRLHKLSMLVFDLIPAVCLRANEPTITPQGPSSHVSGAVPASWCERSWHSEDHNLQCARATLYTVVRVSFLTAGCKVAIDTTNWL